MFHIYPKFILSIFIFFVTFTQAQSQSTVNRLGITDIRETAIALCQIVSTSGNSSRFQLQGEINAQLRGLASRLASAGISGTGTISSEEYAGVTQSEIAPLARDMLQCRERVFNRLLSTLNLSSIQPNQQRERVTTLSWMTGPPIIDTRMISRASAAFSSCDCLIPIENNVDDFNNPSRSLVYMNQCSSDTIFHVIRWTGFFPLPDTNSSPSPEMIESYLNAILRSEPGREFAVGRLRPNETARIVIGSLSRRIDGFMLFFARCGE